MRGLSVRRPVADRLLGPALGVALLLGALAGVPALLAALLVSQGLAVASWHRALAVPGRAHGVAVAGSAAVAANAAAIAAGPDRPLAPVVAVLGLVVPAALLGQLARRDGRELLIPSLTATLAVSTLTTLAATYLVALEGRHGSAVVAAAAVGAGLTVTALAWGQAIPGIVAAAAGPVMAVPAGLLVAVASGLGWPAGLVLAVSGAVAAAAAGVFAGRTPVVRPEVAAAVPLLLAALPAFVLGRLLVG